jgi:hypothetical protein
MTRGELIERVTATVGLQDTDPMDEAALVDHWIYRGTLDLLSRTRCVVRCIHLGLQQGVDTYELADRVLTIVDVDDGKRRRRRRDDNSTGFTLIGSDLFQVSPAPSEDGELDVWAVVVPQAMTDDLHDLGSETYGSIPIEYQDAIELYALWKGADYAHEQNSGRGERYRILYEGQDGRGGRLAQIRVMVNKRGSARPPRRKVSFHRPVGDRLIWVD